MHLVLQTLLFLLCAAYLTIYDCSDFERFLQFPENRICKFNRGKKKEVIFPSDTSLIHQILLDFIAFTVLFLITSAVLAIFSYYNCIKGIREVSSDNSTLFPLHVHKNYFQKNFALLGPFAFFLAILTLFSMYEIFYFTLRGLIMALVKGSINGYMFLVVYSYYIWLRDGPESKLVESDLAYAAVDKGETRNMLAQNL